MTNMANEKIKVIDSVYKELCKWEMRTACNDNPIAALIFLIFLKFASDNRAHFGLDLQDVNYQDIVLDYQEKNKSNEIVMEYVKKIEVQLGNTNGVLLNYANRLALLKFRDKLKPLLNEIQMLDLTVADDMDFSLRDSIVQFLMMQSKKEIRFTVDSITDISLAKLISNIALVKDGMSVYDFTAGYSIVLSEVTKGKDVNIYAQDISESCSAVSLMMLVFGLQKNINLFCDDSLANPCTLIGDPSKQLNKQFDRVVSTPKMGLPISIRNYNAVAFEFWREDISKTDLLFAQHLLASLKSDGKGILLMPVGALNRSGREAELRREMLDHNYIDAVIELPVGIVPPSLIKTALVVFGKNRKSDQIYFLNLGTNAAREYIERSGRATVRITDEGIVKISEIVNERKIEAGLSKAVPCQEVSDNDAKLSASSYIESLPVKEEIEFPDIHFLTNKNNEIMSRLKELNNEFNEIIGEFN